MLAEHSVCHEAISVIYVNVVSRKQAQVECSI